MGCRPNAHIGWMLSLVCFLLSLQVHAQDTSLVRDVEGVVRDSAFRINLKSATIAVYRQHDSALVAYQLTNNFGRYHFIGLPLATRLYVIVSQTGYRTRYAPLLLPQGNGSFQVNYQLDRLSIDEPIDLHEVVVKAVVPVRMNGDTLEFNSDAFALEKNAVVEDLLKKLPGVIVWADGTITVNGKEIKSLKVDGKSFFSGDAKIAIQNISKDAVQKIQVYQVDADKRNQIDSTTEINIKLKNGRHSGHFGKVAAGYAPGRHYEADLALNAFTPSVQMAIVANANNVNKIATDANTIMRNSTFKGSGAQIEYQPDFNIAGKNRPRAIGGMFKKDFSPKPDAKELNQLNIDYFFNSNNATVASSTKTLNYLLNESSQLQLDTAVNNERRSSHRAALDYNKKNEYNNFVVDAHVVYSKVAGSIENVTGIFNAAGEKKSSNTSSNSNDESRRQISLSVGDDYYGRKPRSGDKGLSAKYTLDIAHFQNVRFVNNTFFSVADSSTYLRTERRYDNEDNNVNHKTYLAADDLFRLIFNRAAFIQVSVSNNLDLTKRDAQSRVQDQDSATGKYLLNNYLTNNSTFTTVNEIPALKFQKDYVKILSNRYTKHLSIYFTFREQFLYQQNKSSALFQHFTRRYAKFIPVGAVSYDHYNDGHYHETHNLYIKKEAGYPDVNQLYPLVDSAVAYYLSLGNDRLMPFDKKSITYEYSRSNYMSNNDFRYGLALSYGIINHYFSDSTITDSLGRTRHYTINVNGYRFATISGSVQRAYKIGGSQLQLKFNTAFNFSSIPNSVNNIWYFSKGFTNNSGLRLFYAFRDYCIVELQQYYYHYSSKQTSNISANSYKNDFWTTILGTSFSCTKRLTIGSNVNLNRITASTSQPNTYVVWNTSAAYRMLPAHNLELRLSAMDLLHQNKGFVVTGDKNILSESRSNVLQQYFMVSVAFYPRRFGKKVE